MGEPGTYNGSPVTVLVESYGQTTEQTPGVRLPDATVYVLAADVPQPKRKDVIAWGGVSYQVVAAPESDGQRVAWRLTVNQQVVQ